MVKKLTMFLAALLLSAVGAVAQTQVNGTVVSQDDGEPVVGATVMVVGTQVGAVTDINGKFSLTCPKGKSTLRITYVGMEPIEVGARPNMRILLTSDKQALDEVIVVAYGSAKKSSFTGSASNVNAKDMELRPVTSAVKALEGNVSGVQVTSGSGQPGSSPAIRVRGFGSINASSAPLYVVDGIPYDGSLASINPADIESMTVLKDASAGALYGARGANGVVMITTKQGKAGKANVNWRSTVGWSNRAIKKYDNVDQKEYVQLYYEALRNDYQFAQGYSLADAEAAARASLGGELGGEFYNPFKNYTWDTIIDPATGQVQADAKSAWNEDWMDAVLRKNAFRHEHQFSIDGGSDKTKYMLSLGYLNEDGLLETTSFQRYTARTNVDSQVTDWFKANLSTALTHSESNFSDYDGTSTSNVWYTAQFINPLFPVYLKDAEGKTMYDDQGRIRYDWGEVREDGKSRVGSMSDFSSLGMLMLDDAYTKRDAASVRTGIQFGGDSPRFGWLQGLKLAINFGADYSSSNYMRYMNSEHGNQKNAGGLIQKQNGRTLSYTFNQLLTWNRSFGMHNVDVLFGHEWYDYTYEYLGAGKTSLVNGIKELRPGTTLYDADSYTQKYRIHSLLSRINYNYADRYYLTASIRQDASSRFYVKNNTGTFWSLGANWRVSKEKFLQDVKWLDNLSFKISYGEQGNDNILDSDGYSNYYLWQSLYNLSYANGNAPGGFVETLENKDVTWEKNGNLNIGLEGTFLNNRLHASIEYYNKKTTDMLLNYPLPLSTGFTGYSANVGNMRNQGWEFEVSGSPVKTKDFEWTLGWMGALLNNKVLKLTAESPEIINGARIIKEGYELNTFYMAKSAGVDPLTGQQLYWAYEKDDEGNKVEGSDYITSDYTKANASKYFLGSRIPDLYGSISTGLSYKGLSLTMLTTYSLGGKIYDSSYASSMDLWYPSSTWNRAVLRRWQKPGDITDVPRMAIADGNQLTTDRYLIDASYFAIKNITLSYILPQLWVKKIGLGNVRVFTSMDNVALFSHLDGMDPQYNFSGGTGYDYVPNKTFTIGLEVKF